jgi:peptidoglycan/xylan/chitin deacetylase (PgdA/CDA1 family)
MRKWSNSDSVPEHAAAKKLSDSGDAGQVVLGWDMIKSLEESGLFRFYSHGVTHRKCADLSPRELEVELVDSKECIERRLGKRCDYFCWPYGSFSADTVSAATGAGYKALFTTVDGFCSPGTDPYMLKRIDVKDSVEWLKNKLSEGTE